MKRALKILHEIGTVGFMGAVGAQMILSYTADGMPPAEYATMRYAILVVSKWMLLPSLVVVLVSGLLAMAVHRPYMNAGWAWIKLALTVLVFEGTLVSVQGPAQTAAAVANKIAAGDPSKLEVLGRVIRHERGGLWVLMVLSLVNIVLAVWRPRSRRRRSSASSAAAPSDPASSAESSVPGLDVESPADPE
ncbi:MAG: hypothetical protein AAGF11_26555 [Myxococcota bacterium]